MASLSCSVTKPAQTSLASSSVTTSVVSKVGGTTILSTNFLIVQTDMFLYIGSLSL